MQTNNIQTTTDCPPPPLIRFRSKNYHFASPLLLTDNLEQSKNLSDLKSEINLLIENKKSTGEITTASVYVRRLSDSNWFSLNDEQTYTPASLMKVPIMMTFLKRSQKEPGLLEREIFFNPEWVKYAPSQSFTEKQIAPGKTYKMKDLLYAMVVNSDNYATMLLNKGLDITEFKNLFTSIGLTEPDVRNPKYDITVSGYSKFMRLLYNATYLSDENSDYALWMLSEGSFKEGMLKQLPEGVKVAHKFGEFGESDKGSLKQLHESGIIFFNNNPILITIMTKGTDVKKLPEVINEIAKHIYDRMNVTSKV